MKLIGPTLQRPIWGYIGQQDGGGRRGGVEEAALRGQNCSQGDHLANLGYLVLQHHLAQPEHLDLQLQYSLNPFRRIETQSKNNRCSGLESKGERIRGGVKVIPTVGRR